jgi:acetyl esterase/lipase
MKSHLFVVILAVVVLVNPAVAQLAAAPATAPTAIVHVWPPKKMPGTPATQPESTVPKDDGFTRITNVNDPTLSFFPAPSKSSPAPATIVCPGGGYSYVVVDKEGSEIAAWLNANGISALVLKYRVPHNREGALQDVQRALSLTRSHAAEWNINPKRLGLIGFSAGGNLSAKASTLFDQRAYAPIDDIDSQGCRPDFAVLVYPAYLDDKAGHVSPDLNLKANIPPTLIIHSEDDKTFVPGSKLYHAALDEAKVPTEFLLYPTGGHGTACIAPKTPALGRRRRWSGCTRFALSRHRTSNDEVKTMMALGRLELHSASVPRRTAPVAGSTRTVSLNC